MTPAQYKRALKAVGLSIGGAGPFLGYSRRQSFRIAAGDGEVPEAARKLLELMLMLGMRASSDKDWIGAGLAGRCVTINRTLP